MNNTPRGNRLHIALFGGRNVGKSSLINALTNQQVAIVSNIAGTTTDPVYKSMEILPLGPVVVIDTAGLDDMGELGQMRIKKSLEVLAKTDVALLVMDGERGAGELEEEVVKLCREKDIPVIGVINKIDEFPIHAGKQEEIKQQLGIENLVLVSALTNVGMSELKISLVNTAPAVFDHQTIVGDLISPGDTAVLVTPIDLAAPQGRLILPQVQVIRDVLDCDAMAYVVKERELKECIANMKKKPKIVITDSQAFLKADADTPPDVLLTSFSILFARYKGNLEVLVAGAKTLLALKPGDKVLMEDDIGTVKIPRWIRQFVGGEVHFEWSSGMTMPEDLSQYKLIVHCGACMLNRREMLSRILKAQEQGVSIVNYGVAIAALQGILPRVLSPFPLLVEMLEEDGEW